MSSITSSFYSPAISTSQGVQETNNASTAATFIGQIQTNSQEISSLSTVLSLYISTNSYEVSSIEHNLSNVSSSLSSLIWEFNLLTTSSILSSIYYSFYNLEIYTSSIITSLSNIIPSSMSTLYYSTTIQNTSTSQGFFTEFVSSVYDTAISSVVPSTLRYVSSLVSTLYSTGYALFNSTIASTILSTLNSTNVAYLTALTPQIVSTVTSSLVTSQTYTLSGTNSNVFLDLATYRNFTVNLRGIQDPVLYRVTYSNAALVNRDYATGIITLDISTVGTSYSTNGSLLSFDTYHWGFPTYIEEQFIPYISNADYTMQYQYTILNQTFYTNLLNVYPRTSLSGLAIAKTGSNVVYRNGVNDPNGYWRNGSATVSWIPYMFYPFVNVRGPTYSPQVLVDVLYGTSTVGTSGPFPLAQSTGLVRLPYVVGGTPILSTTLRVYIGGKKGAGATLSTTGYTVLPSFTTITLSSFGTAFLGGNSLSAANDVGTNLLTTATPVTVTGSSSNSAYSAAYPASNLFSANPNSNFVGPNLNNTTGSNTPAAYTGAAITVASATPLSSIFYSTFGTSVAAVTGISPTFLNPQLQRMTASFTNSGVAYNRIFTLTSTLLVSL